MNWKKGAALLGTGLLLAVAVPATAYAAPTRYEAESAPAQCDGTIDANHAGFSGSGFCNADNAAGSFAQFTVNAASAGTATIGIRYANGTTANRPASVSVNGTVVQAASAFGGTGAWTSWATTTVTASLAAGANTVRLAATTANGLANIDFLDVEAGTPPPTGGSPVATNGQLRVCGVNLCNQYNRPIQLRGMSSHGLQWYDQCLNSASLNALASDWNADVLRISMYIQEGGYETNPRLYTDRVHSLIEMAAARGMYAIVDWHMLTPGDPNLNLARARTFFTEIANRHKDKANVIYEVANEPNGVSWSSIRGYHHQIIPVIRAEDADAVILLGTRAWSSLGMSDGANETEVVNNPVNATNIMYTFHFYAASHGSSYLNTLSRAADRIPMFVTEFGTQTASGDGGNNFTQSQAYIDLMAQKKISWVNWNYSDDSRSGAVFTSGTCPNGAFTGTSRLKPAGVWVRDRIRTPDNFPTS